MVDYFGPIRKRLCRDTTSQRKGIRKGNFQNLFKNGFIGLLGKTLYWEYSLTGINFGLFLHFGHICENLFCQLMKASREKREQKIHNVKINFFTHFCIFALYLNRH